MHTHAHTNTQIKEINVKTKVSTSVADSTSTRGYRGGCLFSRARDASQDPLAGKGGEDKAAAVRTGPSRFRSTSLLS